MLLFDATYLSHKGVCWLRHATGLYGELWSGGSSPQVNVVGPCQSAWSGLKSPWEGNWWGEGTPPRSLVEGWLACSLCLLPETRGRLCDSECWYEWRGAVTKWIRSERWSQNEASPKHDLNQWWTETEKKLVQESYPITKKKIKKFILG